MATFEVEAGSKRFGVSLEIVKGRFEMSRAAINPKQILSSDSDDYLNEQAALQRPRCGCEKCCEVRSRAVTLRPKKTLKSGDETRKTWNWTVVRWGERDPESPHRRIMISCHNCGHDSFTPKTSIREVREYPWNGYCPTCVKNFGILGKRRTLTGIYKGNPWGAVIDYNAPHGYNRAVVYCPNYATCGGVTQKKVDASNQDKQPFYCSKCLHEYRKLPWREKLGLNTLNHQSQAGTVTKSSGGRPTVSARRTADVVAAIASKWETVRDNGRHYEAQLKSMTQESLSPYIDELADISGDSEISYSELNKKLNTWFNACRLKEIFPGESRPFKLLVKTVVDELSAGVTKEKISSGLEFRRQPREKPRRAKKAA